MDVKEIRIYFECLEQANHYIKPSIENVLKKLGLNSLPPIKLIKLKKKYDLYSIRITKDFRMERP